MKTRLLVSIAILLIGLSGCEKDQSNPVNTSTDPQQLLGNWRLTEPSSAFKTTLSIDTDKPSGGTVSGIYSFKFTGNAPINSYGTSARLINSATGTIDVESIVTTKVAGAPDAMLFEQTYYTNLKAVTQYELTSKDQLRLYYSGGVLVYDKAN